MGHRRMGAILEPQPPTIVEVELTDMANGGDAVGRYEGRAIFVKNAIAGELVRAEIIEQRRDYLRATMTEILRPSNDRVPIAYPDLVETGGLQWQHIAYPAQLEWKTRIVRQLLQRVGHFPRPPVQLTLGTPPEVDYWRQRTVAQFAVGPDGAIGFRRTGSHDVLDMPACPIAHPTLDAAYQAIRRWVIGRWGADAGNFIERFTVRVAVNPPDVSGPLEDLANPNSSQPPKRKVARRKTLVLLSIEARPGGGITSEGPEMIGKEIMQAVPSVAGVVIVGLSGHRGRVVIGQDYLMEQVMGKTYRISAGSFFQVNASQTQILVQKALAFAQPRHNETILDGYSGVGLFSLFLAEQAAHVTAIESQPSAVADARASAAFNHVGNMTIVEGLLERVIGQMVHTRQHADIVIVDPPRAGCHPRALQQIKNLNPRCLVYISCDPATLARDLHLFCTDNYRLAMIQPVDMFPNTAHIETVSLIERW